ncbi:MAG TPA: SgcJ/EcaC family oxidoreductase [Ktedonobacteraceae bacterium]
MSNSASDDTPRPTVNRVEGQPDADTAIAAFVSELQQGWDHRNTAISNRHVAADVAWGSPYGATVHGYDQLHAIHTRLKQQGIGGSASRYEIVRAFAVSDDVIVAHVARYALDPEGRPIEPASETTGAFSEMALYVLVRRDGAWWVAAGQNTPIRPGGAVSPDGSGTNG